MNAKLLFLATLLVASFFFLYSSLTSHVEAIDFKSEIVQIDTADVILIQIHYEKNNTGYELTRESRNWIISDALASVPAKTAQVNRILATFASLTTDKIVCSSPDNWQHYNIDRDQGYRISFTDTKGTTETLTVGFFPNEEHAYLRVKEDNAVYRIPRAAAIASSQPMSVFRPQHLLRLPADVTAIQYTTPDTAFVLATTPLGWQNNITQTVVDSSSIQQYLASIDSVNSKAFTNNFDETSPAAFAYKKIEFWSSTDSTILYCFRDTNRVKPFIFYSPINDRSWFESDSAGLFKDIVYPLDTLVAK